MKKSNVVVLIVIVAAIVALITWGLGDFSSYDSVASAQAKKGQYVHMIAKLDKSAGIEYDPIKNPNYLVFTAKDTLGNSVKVVYHNSKPAELEQSERVVLKGKMTDTHFECKEILVKCPSKYKEEKGNLEKTINKG
jgi:cytochrome c-type biogenesis protein CcmE